MTISDIRSRTDITDPERAQRAKQLVSFYQGVSPNGDIVFITNSQFISGKSYTQYVRLYDLPILSKSPYYANNEKALLKDSMRGRVGVYCSDPSFLYWGWQYISFTFDYGWNSASFPSIRNPYLRGGICKHLYHVFMVLPFNFSRIYAEMKRRGLLSYKEGGGI